jgi:signal transduction histidine kinase
MDFEIKKHVITFQGSEGILVVINDLSSLAKEKQQQAMEHCSEVMIATTSHDLRTPLNSMQNMIHMLGPEVKTRKAKQYLKVAEQSTGIMNQLI